LNSASGERSVLFNVGDAPAINLAVTSSRNYGTLVVETGESDVSVIIDGQRYPRQTAGGQIRMPLEAKEHVVRVAKDGYRVEPAEFRATITKGEQVRARFRLTPEPARLAVTEGIPGASVIVDGRNVGTVGADGTLSVQLPPGEHRIELTRSGYVPAEVRRTFGPGRTVQLSSVDARLTAVETPKPQQKTQAKSAPVEPPPARPDSAALELADWQRVSRNPTIAELEDFLRRHPGGSHAAEAGRVLERLDWDATNKSSRPALQAFLAKHPSGTYAAQATAELTRMESEAAAAVQQQQEADRIRTEREQVRSVLNNYGQAYGRKDADQMVALWPSLPQRSLRQIRDSFRTFRAVKMELRPLAEPEISGNTARVQCARYIEAVDRNGTHPNQDTVTVRLEKRGGRWVIDSMQ
jgi:hypothetical protein